MRRVVCLGTALLLVLSLFSGSVLSSPHASVSAASPKLVAFTFDDGCSTTTSRLLDGLKSLGAKATFFVNGANGPSLGASRYPATLQRMADEGHQIANHTNTHYVPFDALSASAVESEVNTVNTYLYKAMGGNYQTLVRTPGGATSATIKAHVGAPIILWDVDTLDWKYRNATTVYNNILNSVSDGSIVLLHDIYDTSVTAALNAIRTLQSRGYECVTVAELFRRRGITLQNGTVYTHAPNKGVTLGAYRAPSVTTSLNFNTGKTRVTIETPDSGITLYYTTDGSIPTLASKRYTAPFEVPAGTTVRAAGYDAFGTRTEVAKAAPDTRYEGVFDAVYYANRYPELKDECDYTEEGLLKHFLSYGLAQGKQASPVFSITYYMSCHADLKNAFGHDRMKYINHFLNYGMKEGRRASAEFDPVSYRLYYPDLRRALGNGWKAYYLHYIKNGLRENRYATGCRQMRGAVTVYNGVDYAAVYDYTYYTAHYADVKKTYGYDDAAVLRHFAETGMNAKHQGNEAFSVESYYRQYPDLRRAFGTTWASYYRHYLRYGAKEGRKGSGCTEMRGYTTVLDGVNYAAVYDFNDYVAHNADVLKAFGYNDKAVLSHFVQYGMKEGRYSSDSFSLRTYRARYADLRQAFGTNNKAYYMHYIQYGCREGRRAV